MLTVNRLLLPVVLLCIAALFTGCTSSRAAANQAAAATSPPAAPTATPPRPTASPTPLAPNTATDSPTPPATTTTALQTSPTATTAPEPTSSPTSQPPATEPPVNAAELAAAGLQIYKDQYCGICHELDVAQTKGIFGPPHNDMAAVAAQRIADSHYTGSATTPADYIRESLLEPEKYLVQDYANNRHAMPAYTHLTDSQIEALVQFLLRQ